MPTIETAASIVRDRSDRDRLLQLQRRDPPVPEQLIRETEVSLGATLPPPFRQLVAMIGTGDFGSLELYSLVASPWSLTAVNGSKLQPQRDFVAISHDGFGNYFGFEVECGACRPAVMIQDHLTGERRLADEDLAAWFLREAFEFTTTD